LRLELSDLNEVKSQETQRSLDLQRKRGELVVRVEQFKRRMVNQKKNQALTSKDKQHIEGELEKVVSQQIHLENEN
tara:strand:+ start:687 stop:914 length:228 start_codon:yes stop_codon:yes gene_type:complete